MLGRGGTNGATTPSCRHGQDADRAPDRQDAERQGAQGGECVPARGPLHSPGRCNERPSALPHLRGQVVNGPEVLNKYVGASEENIRNLFADAEAEYKKCGDASGAREQKKGGRRVLETCPVAAVHARRPRLAELHVIIFDEIDAICKARGSVRDGSGVHDTIVNQVCVGCVCVWGGGGGGPAGRAHAPSAAQQLLTPPPFPTQTWPTPWPLHTLHTLPCAFQLLTKIDGVDALNNILLIGMTNRKDMLDEALLRPGRLEVQVRTRRRQLAWPACLSSLPACPSLGTGGDWAARRGGTASDPADPHLAHGLQLLPGSRRRPLGAGPAQQEL